ncbi:MAG: hypothetical protein ACHBNF_14010 [Chromatiales bacterium]
MNWSTMLFFIALILATVVLKPAMVELGNGFARRFLNVDATSDAESEDTDYFSK